LIVSDAWLGAETVNVIRFEAKLPEFGNCAHSVHVPTDELANVLASEKKPDGPVTPAGNTPDGVQSCVPSGWMAQRLNGWFWNVEETTKLQNCSTVKLPLVAPLIVSDAAGAGATETTFTITESDPGADASVSSAAARIVWLPKESDVVSSMNVKPTFGQPERPG